MKATIAANLDTNLPNRRAQLAKLKGYVKPLQDAIETLEASIAQEEKDRAVALQRINAARAQAKKATYPPYCITKASQQAYLRQLRHDEKIAKNRPRVR